MKCGSACRQFTSWALCIFKSWWNWMVALVEFHLHEFSFASPNIFLSCSDWGHIFQTFTYPKSFFFFKLSLILIINGLELNHIFNYNFSLDLHSSLNLNWWKEQVLNLYLWITCNFNIKVMQSIHEFGKLLKYIDSRYEISSTWTAKWH